MRLVMEYSEVRPRARAKIGRRRQPDGCEAGGTTRSIFEPGWSEIHFEALWLPRAGQWPAQASRFDQTAWSFGIPAGRVAASRTAASPFSAWGRKRTAVFRTSRISGGTVPRQPPRAPEWCGNPRSAAAVPLLVLESRRDRAIKPA
jgi:hypothetical protein